MKKPIRQGIKSVEFWRTPSHPRSNNSMSATVTLECGHEKRYKASKVPNEFAFCKECVE